MELQQADHQDSATQHRSVSTPGIDNVTKPQESSPQADVVDSIPNEECSHSQNSSCQEAVGSSSNPPNTAYTFPINPGNTTTPEVRQRQEFNDGLQWYQRPIVKIKVSGLPVSIDTKHVWQRFEEYGSIQSIEIVQDLKGQPKAFILYRPAPKVDFWNRSRFRFPWMGREWRVSLKMIESSYTELYQVGAARNLYPQILELSAEFLDFGILYTASSMKTFYQSQATSEAPIFFRLNLIARRIEIVFPHEVHIKTNEKQTIYRSTYRFTLSLNAPIRLFKIGGTSKDDANAIIILTESPPEFSREYAQKDCHKAGQSRWQANDVWHRVTDLGNDEFYQNKHPTSLSNSNLNVNLGRWTTYRIGFGNGVLQSDNAIRTLDVLASFNLETLYVTGFEMVTKPVRSVFELLEIWSAKTDQQPMGIESLTEIFRGIRVSLDFQVRYQLEVCISEGYLSEYNLDLEFLETLQKMEPSRARGLLVGVAAKKQRFFDPMNIFNEVRIKPDSLRLPNHSFYSRSIVITPTTIYLATPSLDVSNRVIRRYREHTDRFLRVRFAEERPRGRLQSSANSEAMTQVYIKVKEVLMNGIVIGNRHYQFLAFGNSQLREHAAYFFCSAPGLFPENIREWMGTFDDKVVAKYAARLGQCFSTTRACLGINPSLGEMLDDKTSDGKHNFTDGVGIISPFLAKVAASECGTLTLEGTSPSALQFRLGGCKGVLAVWPWVRQNMGHDIYIRPSQAKFLAQHQGLEINRWSQFSSAYLNRQLITILKTLGVKDSVFREKLDRQLSQLDEAMVNPIVAVKMLQRDIDPHQMSLELATMVKNHFQVAKEPFMLSVLHLWRAYTIKWLKEKAKILVHKGAHLLGVIDETKTLRGHFNEEQVYAQATHDPDYLPQIFVQLSNYDDDTGMSGPKIIEGIVVLARNPSLHPGDIRVVRAVNNEDLRHLKDVVVLPKNGDRDLASMCSGGDLDGDDFIIIWDQALIPTEWNHEPMDFTPPPPLVVDHAITMDDITSFFVQYIKNDNLGSVANAHLAWADQSPEGAKAKQCLELASIHSIAVDYPKSGNAAVMPPLLRPKLWPHFMEKPKGSYHSKTALGQLYDRVELVDFKPDYTKPFDNRILDKCRADEVTYNKVAHIKAEYDEGVRRIMVQHGIEHELEVWSTFVLRHNGIVNNYKFNEEIGRLSASLKEAIRNKCYDEAGGRTYEKIAPFAAAMYKVTSLQIQDALQKIGQGIVPTRHSMPYISFPWIFASVLGDIALGRSFLEVSE